MSTQTRRTLAATLIVAGTIAYFAVVNWLSDPQPGRAQTEPPPPPEVSIVFVIDSSPNMFPTVRPNYFDLAKEGIVEFLSHPGFPTDGRYEIGVIQFTKNDAFDYVELEPFNLAGADYGHWISPTVIASDADRDQFVAAVSRLERSTHHSSVLLEVGIREAKDFLVASAASEKHMALLTTGAYRFRSPCPDSGYTWADDPDNPDANSCKNGLTTCVGPSSSSCTDNCPEICSRACHVRYFAAKAHEQNIRVSAFQLGSPWRDFWATSDCKDYTYPDDPPNYCADAPEQPGRTGLLHEISECTGGNVDAMGKYVQINPFYCFSGSLNNASACDPENFKPGQPADISDALATWLCEAIPVDPDNPDAQNPDGDYFGGDLTRPIYSICDNCPDTFNQRQRDCNRDGIGDACQFDTDACGKGTNPGDDDFDDDGLCDELDVCQGGDDCLVTTWAAPDDCVYEALDQQVSLCGQNCNHNAISDACDAAIELNPSGASVTLPFWAHDRNPINGIPDCCDHGTCACDGVPSTCDLAGKPDATYIEDFSAFIAGEPFILQEGHGWYQDPNSDPAAVEVMTVQVEDSSGELVERKVVELRIDETLNKDATDEWFLEGPALVLPSYTCTQATDGTLSEPALKPTVDSRPWGTVLIDVDLYIGNKPSQTAYDLYILGAPVGSVDDRARVHLRFSDVPDADDYGLITSRSPSGCATDYGLGWRLIRYPIRQWFTLRILITQDENLGWLDGACYYTGTRTGVRVMRFPRYGMIATGPEACGENIYVEELNPHIFVQRDVQLRFVTDNTVIDGEASAAVLQIGTIRVQAADQCAFHARSECDHDDCRDNHGNSCSCVCQDTDVPSLCVYTERWECLASYCGDDRLDTAGGETCESSMCDPFQDVPCCEDCSWVCGDGAVQGGEECDDGNQIDDDVCSNECTCNCP